MSLRDHLLSPRAPANNNVPSRYAVIIDAGSSGSRVHVYSWPDPTDKSSIRNKGDRANVPQLTQHPEWNKKISPGIAQFKGQKSELLWDKHLKKLMEHAESIIPAEDRFQTPVFLLATAGMRLLPSEEQNNILSTACDSLKTKTNFYLPECMSHVSVIDGETEGLYGWVALNYLLGEGQTFSDPRTNQATSYGFMDMGGASAQIAFAPNVTEALRHEDDLFRINIRTLNGHDHKWKVFVSTWLGFGANKARDRYSEQLISEQSNSHYDNDDDTRINDPCLPKQAELEYKFDNGTEYKFNGIGDFSKCLKRMYPLLQKELPCKDDPCLFNGVHVPAIDFSTNRFVGVSEYWYTANDILKLGGKYDFIKFSARTQEYCSKDWGDILNSAKSGEYHGLSKNILRSACFKATWIINILHEGFGVPIDPKDLSKSSSLLKRDTDDDDVLPFLMELSKRDTRDFSDPFQSAVTIRGQELSWTMGRALLYASSQIPPAKHTQDQVGYVPWGENAQFVVGGELDIARPPIRPSYGVLEPALSFGLKAILVCGFLVAIFLYMFYNFFGKSQRYFMLGSAKHRVMTLYSWTKRTFFKAKRRQSSVSDTANEAAERLLEEGEGDYMAASDDFIMKDYNSNNGLKSSPSAFQLRRFDSNTSLSTTTSMVNLRTQTVPPSRVNSRIGMSTPDINKSDAPASKPVSFSLGNDDPYESDGYNSNTNSSWKPASSSPRGGSRTRK